MRGATVDLSGWRLEDRFYLRHIFPAGTLLADGCAVVVFGGGTPTGTFGGSVIQKASTGGLWLNNDTERVTLLDPALEPVAAYSYGLEADKDQSLTRNPDITGPEPLVQHALMNSTNSLLNAPRAIRSSAVKGLLLNLRMVTVGPFKASGGIMTFTREPSGRRAST